MPLTIAFEAVWQRIRAHEGEEFATKTGLPFHYTVEGSSTLWVFRNGNVVNKSVHKSQFEKALRRVPLNNTSAVNDLICYPYVYSIMMDARIRRGHW